LKRIKLREEEDDGRKRQKTTVQAHVLNMEVEQSIASLGAIVVSPIPSTHFC
jgi:hypothetical protein